MPKENNVKNLIKNIGKKIRNSNWFFPMLSRLFCLYVWLVGKTTRWESPGLQKFYSTLEKDKSLIMISWHGRIAMLPYFWDNRCTLRALVSLHRDGKLIINVLRSFGIEIIGGSTNKNAFGAAMALMRTLNNNNSIAIIPDGPRGPSMQLTMSPLYYARKTGKPIVGIGYSIKGSKILAKSWDSLMIPPLFSKGIFYATEPYYIPKNATKEDMEKYRLQIEENLNNLTHEADKKMGIPYIKPGKEAKKKHAEQ